MDQKPATPSIEAAHGATLASLPFADDQDFADADRGFLAALEPGVVTAADGRVVWDNDSYSFLDGEAPPTVNPSLWRQSQLVARQGLFEVVDGIYQVRGLDLSNITFVEGDTGVIVIDPLISTETAAAALGLYRMHRGDRTVVAVIYSHSHVDHFGGVFGVATQEEVDSGTIAVIAPEGFVGHAVEENVYAGTAMSRRAGYMYGAVLDRGPQGQVGAGLGQTTSAGEVGLIVPTLEVTTTGETHTIDGVEIEFQMAPGTEAPAEMHFYFPRYRALCMAENATHTLHNLLTLRGALVRDPHVWSQYLTEAIETFGSKTDAVFSSHHWPTWGAGRIVGFLSTQRDLYAYLHDQTLRLLNQGYTGTEIAEMLELPPALQASWNTHGYYGSVSHNVKAIYQRYMGWFDGNPARLWAHTPSNLASRYVDAIGGIDRVVEVARTAFDAGDFRWAATLLDHAVFADETARRRAGALRRHARATRIRRRERHVAQLLPLRCDGAPRCELRHADRDERTRDRRTAHARAALRRDRDLDRRTEGVGPHDHARRHLHRPRRELPRNAPQRRLHHRRKGSRCRLGRRDDHHDETPHDRVHRRGHHISRPRDHRRRRRAAGTPQRARRGRPVVQHRHAVGGCHDFRADS